MSYSSHLYIFYLGRKSEAYIQACIFEDSEPNGWSQSEFMEQQHDWEMGLMEAYQEAVDGEVVETNQQVEENEVVCDKYMQGARRFLIR